MLADLQEFYELTLLDENKSTQQKTVETLQIASRWELDPPIVANQQQSEVCRRFVLSRHLTTAVVLRPLCRSTCVSRHLQLRTGGFCCCKVVLPMCPCDSNQHIRIREKALEFSLSSVIYSVSIPS